MNLRIVCYTAMLAVTAASCGIDQAGPAGIAAPDAQHVAAARLLSASRPVASIPVFIDGARYFPPAAPTGFNIIDPQRIATVQLLTGPDAEVHAGAQGRRGVIWIATKAAAR